MPIYIFRCSICSKEKEFFCSMGERDEIKAVCRDCDIEMSRVPASINYHGEKYQMKAIMSDGTKRAGHFGKSAPLLRGKK
jgi:hypothetical protein